MVPKLPLGIADREVESGEHLLSIYQTRSEQVTVAADFLAAGLRNYEQCASIGDEALAQDIRAALAERGLDVHSAMVSGQLVFLVAREFYYDQDQLKLDHIAGLVRDAIDDARRQGYQALRVVGENFGLFSHPDEIEVWAEYEARVNDELRGKPAIALCQYDQMRVPGHLLVNMIKTHPKVVVNGVLHENPFYQEPEAFLRTRPARWQIC